MVTKSKDPIAERAARYKKLRADIDCGGGLMGPISLGYRHFGFTRGESQGKPGVWYREWAPAARGLSLIGDFNGWNRSTSPLTRDADGVWSAFFPSGTLEHGARVKVHVQGADGSAIDRIPAYALRVVQDERKDFSAEVWLPVEFRWAHAVRPKLPPREGLRIYEAHAGMATEEGRVGTFSEFTANILPRIARLGYNAVQLMAVQEHPYYGSFGYHVSSFFAVSSRFGTPDDLKTLIDAAHGLGLQVFLDLVHSHGVRNILEGLDRFDGSGDLYFNGEHPAWDSKLFDYARPEVRSFLLSNVRYWLEELRFDGIRFDGVTSMLYFDHGLGRNFGSYDDYFGPGVHEDALQYLQLANDLAHSIAPGVVTIAEDMSGMPGTAKPPAEGGLGFDYRLAMGVPDYWIKVLKEKRDEEWNLGDLWHTLLNRRHDEGHIGYAESHDQALVGDQTIAFRLMGAEMYGHMARDRGTPKIDRGLSLHKIIRLLTFSLSGDGWLSFMGNEFGHPEWIDFPREGNNWSYHYARRQWSLADNPVLYYQGLERFDTALMSLDRLHALLSDPLIEQLFLHEDNKVLAYRRGPLVFAVNLHPTASYDGFRLPVPDRSDYRMILSTDSSEFSGHGRTTDGMKHPWQMVPCSGREQSVQIYLPSRCGLVFAPLS